MILSRINYTTALLAVSLLALPIQSIWAVSSTDVLDSCEADLTVNQPFLYQLEKDGKTSYMLGTLHFGVSIKSFPPETLEILKSCTRMTQETSEPGSVLAFWEKVCITKSMVNVLPPRLSAQLSELEWKTLVERVTANGLPAGIVNFMTPLSATFISSPNINAMSKALERGRMEEELAALVATLNVKVGGLEAASFQRLMLKSMFSLKNLKEVLNTPPKSPEAAKKADTYQQYLKGDEQPYIDQNEKYRTEKSDFYRTALLARNAAWIPKILKLHAKPGTGLIAVGVAHLFGDKEQDNGVLNLLRKQGFTVTRVGARLNP